MGHIRNSPAGQLLSLDSAGKTSAEDWALPPACRRLKDAYRWDRPFMGCTCECQLRVGS